jgi:hypothetical protein
METPTLVLYIIGGCCASMTMLVSLVMMFYIRPRLPGSCLILLLHLSVCCDTVASFPDIYRGTLLCPIMAALKSYSELLSTVLILVLSISAHCLIFHDTTRFNKWIFLNPQLNMRMKHYLFLLLPPCITLIPFATHSYGSFDDKKRDYVW